MPDLTITFTKEDAREWAEQIDVAKVTEKQIAVCFDAVEESLSTLAAELFQERLTELLEEEAEDNDE